MSFVKVSNLREQAARKLAEAQHSIRISSAADGECAPLDVLLEEVTAKLD